MLELYRDGLYLYSDTVTVPYQGSVNIPIALTVPNSDDEYLGYAVQPKVSYHDGTVWQSILVPYEDGQFELPAQVFAVNGFKKIAIGLIDDGKEYVTNEIKLIVNSAPTGTVVLPISPQWNDLVEAYMAQRYDLDYVAKFEELQGDYRELLEEIQAKIKSLEGEVSEQFNEAYANLRIELEEMAEAYKEIYDKAIVEFAPLTEKDIQEVFEYEEWLEDIQKELEDSDEEISVYLQIIYEALKEKLESMAAVFEEIYSAATVEFQPIEELEIMEMFAEEEE